MADPVINRFLGSTTGPDVEFIELYGDPGTSLAGLSLIVVESDSGPSTGAVDARFDFAADAAIGANGFFLVGNSLVAGAYGVTPDAEIDPNFVENSSYTLALVETASLAGGAVTGAEVVIDAVGVTDGGIFDTFFFGAPVIGPEGSFLPAGGLRLVDGVDTGSAADWQFADFGLGAINTPRAAGASVPVITAPLVSIMEIQGAGLTSDLEGETVATSGIVTQVDRGRGFWIQDAAGDGDDATSDAVFVFGASGSVAVGDTVTVQGAVVESAFSGEQPTTQIDVDIVLVTGAGAALPAAVALGGPDGRTPPSTSVADAIAFYESLEGMRVTAEEILAVAPTNRFGEIYGILPGPDGGYDNPSLSERGTLNIAEGDFNPERVQISRDSSVFSGAMPQVDTGAVLEGVTGILAYSFGNYEIVPTAPVGVASASPLAPEVTQIATGGGDLTIATYNVLNLDPNDADGDRDVALGRFDAVAAHVVDNLGLPDILALQEIQDNDGSVLNTGEGPSSATETLALLAERIFAASGIRYEVVDTPNVPTSFIDETGEVQSAVGGAPGGNIRTAYLYNPDRVSLVEGSVVGITDTDGDPYPFFEGRIPLLAEWEFEGERVSTINVHLSSKGGSAPLFGTVQPTDTAEAQENPAINGSLDQRIAQAEFLRDYIAGLDASGRMVVLGDFNEFEFVSPLEILSGPGYTNLTETLPENERYSYIFEGNSQSLDHIIVSDAFAQAAEFDAVHVNAEFAETATRASDHDPLLAALDFTPTAVDDEIFVLGRKFRTVDVTLNDIDPGLANAAISEINGQAVGRKPVFFSSLDGKKLAIIKLNEDGTLSVKTPKKLDDFVFTYRLSDGVRESAEAQVRVEVIDRKDALALTALHAAADDALVEDAVLADGGAGAGADDFVFV